MVIQAWKPVFILCLSIILSFVTTLVRSVLTDKEKLNSQRREIAAWNAAFKEARRTENKRLLAKVQRQQSQIMKMQADMNWKSMRISFIFIIPFLLVWLGLTGGILGRQLFVTPFTSGGAIAYLPWFGGSPLELNLFWWYFLCSIASGILFTRVFGLGMEVTD